MENKQARITEVSHRKHYVPTVKLNKVTTVQIENSTYEFTQVFNPVGVVIDNTMIWKGYDSQDPFNWDGKDIGASDMSVDAWLAGQGFDVVWDAVDLVTE